MVVLGGGGSRYIGSSGDVSSARLEISLTTLFFPSVSGVVYWVVTFAFSTYYGM